MSYRNIKVIVSDDGVADINIQNQTALNILNTDTILELTQVLRKLSRSEELRVLLLRGGGEKAFIGGADIYELASLDPDTSVDFISRLGDLCEVVRKFPVPTIAIIDGWCMGGGLELAACTDIRVGSEVARFAMPEVRVGIPSVIHANLLSRLIGEGNARWMLLSASVVDAETAFKWGLLTKLADQDSLNDEVRSTVEEILLCAPKAVRAQKRLLMSWEDPHIEKGIVESIEIFSQSYETDEPRVFCQKFFDRKKNKST